MRTGVHPRQTNSLRRFYGIGDERPTHYDLEVNTDRLDSQDSAKLIVGAARSADLGETPLGSTDIR